MKTVFGIFAGLFVNLTILSFVILGSGLLSIDPLGINEKYLLGLEFVGFVSLLISVELIRTVVAQEKKESNTIYVFYSETRQVWVAMPQDYPDIQRFSKTADSAISILKTDLFTSNKWDTSKRVEIIQF